MLQPPAPQLERRTGKAKHEQQPTMTVTNDDGRVEKVAAFINDGTTKASVQLPGGVRKRELYTGDDGEQVTLSGEFRAPTDLLLRASDYHRPDKGQDMLAKYYRGELKELKPLMTKRERGKWKGLSRWKCPIETCTCVIRADTQQQMRNERRKHMKGEHYDEWSKGAFLPKKCCRIINVEGKQAAWRCPVRTCPMGMQVYPGVGAASRERHPRVRRAHPRDGGHAPASREHHVGRRGAARLWQAAISSGGRVERGVKVEVKCAAVKTVKAAQQQSLALDVRHLRGHQRRSATEAIRCGGLVRHTGEV